jgi:glycine oxidase
MKQSDLLIIGGGVIGLSIAWQAARRGVQVHLVERGDVGREAAHAAGGMLAPLAEADRDDPFLQLCRMSRALYQQFASELFETTGIDVEYRTEGTLFISLKKEDDEELESRYDWQRKAGIAIERLSADQIQMIEPALNPALRWGLRFPDDHQVNNRRLVKALHAAALVAGVEITTQTTVLDLLTVESGGRSKISGIVTDRGRFEGSRVILAAGCWSGQLHATTPVFPVRGQMIAVEMPVPGLSQVVYSCRGYLVPRRDGSVIAGSTTEMVGYDRRITTGGLASIIANSAEIMPSFSSQPILETWAGLRPRVTDQLPVLGADPAVDGLFLATGHYRNGILLAPLTGQLMADLITGDNPGIDLTPFSPARLIASTVAV